VLVIGIHMNCKKPARSTASVAASMLPPWSAAAIRSLARIEPRIVLLECLGQCKDEHAGLGERFELRFIAHHDRARELGLPAVGHQKWRRFVCGDQSGRTSGPISPHAVQTIRGSSVSSTASSGNQSALSWHYRCQLETNPRSAVAFKLA
jgi:hypothetical protein